MVAGVTRAALLAIALALPAPVWGSPRAECDVAWRFTPRMAAPAPYIDAEVAWRAGDAATSDLVLPRAWGGVELTGSVRDFRARSNHQWVLDRADPARKTVTHLPREHIAVRYRIDAHPGDADRDSLTRRDVYGAIVGRDWFHFVGHAAFVVPASLGDDTPARLCVAIDGSSGGGWIVSSLGARRGRSAVFARRVSAERLRHAVYFGGRFDVRERRIHGRRLWIARRGPWRFDMDVYTDLAARIVATQRAFFDDFELPPLAIELLHTNQAVGPSGGTALDNALVMYAPDSVTVPGEQLEFLLAHEHLHAWIPRRFGAMGDNEALRYWFSEGFTDFYTHRLLVRGGVWTLAQYAAALNRKIEQYLQTSAHEADNARVAVDFFSDPAIGALPYLRGELLALKWHRALVDRRPDGLDGVMRPLLLARGVEASARTPLPLATARLLGALAAPDPDAGADVVRYVEHGEPMAFDERSLGPCFAMRVDEKPRFDLGFDRRSVKEGRMVGVDRAGPAYAAGLRDGQPIRGFYLYEGDVSKDATVLLRDDAGTETAEISFRPVAAQRRGIPVYAPQPDAGADPACRAWFGMPAPAG